MSRVGRLPVKIPDKVKVTVANGDIKVEGPKGKMHFPFNPIVNRPSATSSACPSPACAATCRRTPSRAS